MTEFTNSLCTMMGTAALDVWPAHARASIVLLIPSFSQVAQSEKTSILTLYACALVILCGILIPSIIYFIRARHQTRAVERNILRFSKADGYVSFHDVSNKTGCPHSKILEITKHAIAKGKISGAITFDKAGFISETELRRRFPREDLPLSELVAEISKIDSPEVKILSPHIAADSRPIRSVEIPISEAVVTGEEIGKVKPMVKREPIFTPITEGVQDRRVDLKKRGEKKPRIEVVTKEQRNIFRSLEKHWKRVVKARRQR